jgi:hypothetical protein
MDPSQSDPDPNKPVIGHGLAAWTIGLFGVVIVLLLLSLLVI